MWTLFGADGSGSAALVSRCSGVLARARARAHFQPQRLPPLALLLRVESQRDLAPVFARHGPG